LEQTVHKSSLLISNRIEAEFSKELHAGIRQRLAELERGLKEELEAALASSKAELRSRLKECVQEMVMEGRGGDGDHGSDHDINMRDSQPIPFFDSDKSAAKAESRKERVKQEAEPKKSTKVASYLKRFLESA
jgi:hypothetical protein